MIAVREEAREVGQARHQYRAECSCMDCRVETLVRTLPAQLAMCGMQVSAGNSVRSTLECEVSGERGSHEATKRDSSVSGSEQTTKARKGQVVQKYDIT